MSLRPLLTRSDPSAWLALEHAVDVDQLVAIGELPLEQPVDLLDDLREIGLLLVLHSVALAICERNALSRLKVTRSPLNSTGACSSSFASPAPLPSPPSFAAALACGSAL